MSFQFLVQSGMNKGSRYLNDEEVSNACLVGGYQVRNNSALGTAAAPN